jgi:hypothetical protein
MKKNRVSTSTIYDRINEIRAIHIILTMETQMADIVWQTVKAIWGAQERAHKGIMDTMIRTRVAETMKCGNTVGVRPLEAACHSLPLLYKSFSW